MVNGSRALIPAIILGLLCTGCAKRVPFTHSLAETAGSSNLPELQFYISKKITLRHELTEWESGVTPGHILKIEKGKRIEGGGLCPAHGG